MSEKATSISVRKGESSGNREEREFKRHIEGDNGMYRSRSVNLGYEI